MELWKLKIDTVKVSSLFNLFTKVLLGLALELETDVWVGAGVGCFGLAKLAFRLEWGRSCVRLKKIMKHCTSRGREQAGAIPS